jgi:hypothetical protein
MMIKTIHHHQHNNKPFSKKKTQQGTKEVCELVASMFVVMDRIIESIVVMFWSNKKHAWMMMMSFFFPNRLAGQEVGNE